MIPFAMSIDARTLADRLLAVPVGETITLPEIGRTLGRDISQCRHLLYTALRIVRREAGAIFVCKPRIGYQRLSAEAVAETVGTHARARVRRTARRARVAIEAGIQHNNALPPEVQRRASAEISAFALLEHLARDATVKPKEDAPLTPEPVAATARRLLGTQAA